MRKLYKGSSLAIDIEADLRREDELKRTAERKKSFTARDWDKKVEDIVRWAEERSEEYGCY
jgi:hypothetical protein